MKWKRRLGVIGLVAVAQIGIIYAYHVFQTTTLAWPSVHQLAHPAKGGEPEANAAPTSVRQPGLTEPLLPPSVEPPGQFVEMPKKVEGGELSEPPPVPTGEPSAPGDNTLKDLLAQQLRQQHKETVQDLQKMTPAEPPPLPPPPLPPPPSVPPAPVSQLLSVPDPKEAPAPAAPEPGINPLLQKKESAKDPPTAPTPRPLAPVPPAAPPGPAPDGISPPIPEPRVPQVPAPDPDVIQAGVKITRPAPAPGAQPSNIPMPPLSRPEAPPSAALSSISSPWTLQVEVVDGKTILTASTSKDARFRVSCDKLDLQAPRGHMKAVGGVTIASSGLEASCDSLTIHLQEDLMQLEGKAQVKCLRDKRELEMKADRFSLRLSETTGTAASAASAGSSGKTAGKKEFKVYNLSVYQCRPGESAASISRKLYGTEKYAHALVQFNRDYQGRDNLTATPGATLYYPPKELLEQSYADVLTRGQGRGVGSYQ